MVGTQEDPFSRPLWSPSDDQTSGFKGRWGERVQRDPQDRHAGQFLEYQDAFLLAWRKAHMEFTPQNNYQVLFKILHKETNKPLPDVLVVLLDLDSFNDPEKPVILMSAPEPGAASTGPDITK